MPRRRCALSELSGPFRQLGEFVIALASAAAQHADAMIVFADPLTNCQGPRIIALAEEDRLPAVYLFREYADDGLIVYGRDIADLFRRAGGYVSKILKGALSNRPNSSSQST